MGIQKFRADKAWPICGNRSQAWVAVWMGGESLSKIANCPCSDGVTRTVYIQGDADTYFPAAIMVKKHRVNGFVTRDEEGWQFTISRADNT